MMRNKKELKGFLLTATRLVVLALCFVTVFAVALTSDVIVIDGSDSALNVADATTVDSDGKTPIDLGITADSFNFPKNDGAYWSYTKSLSNINLSYGNNVSLSKPEDTNVDVTLTANGNRYDVKNSSNATRLMSVVTRVNFDVGDFVRQVVAEGKHEVKVTIDATYTNDNGKNHSSGLIAMSGNDKASASESIGDRSATITLTNAKSYVGFVTYCESQNQVGGIWPTITSFSVVFNSITIEISGLKDGAAPIVSSKYGLQNNYVKGVSGSGYAPYVTSNDDASGFPVHFNSIKDYLKTDSVSEGSGKMLSYTSKAIDKINGKNYYKFAQTEYVDMFNRTDSSFDDLIARVTGGGTVDADTLSKIGAGDKVLSVSGNNYSWNDPSETHFLNASGIKTVKVGDTVFDIYNSSGNAYGSQTKEVTVSDTDGKIVSVGYATVTRTNRSRVVVSIYFTTNGTVQTEVTDYSGLMVTTLLEVTGIDTSLDDNVTPISDNDYLKGTKPGEWLYDSLLEVGSAFENNDDTTAANYSPRLWFFTAKRADELSGLGSAHVFGSIAELLASGLKPIGIGDGFTFNYNFADGKAKSFGSDAYDAIGTLGADGKVTSESSAKGHGYYLFTFYTIDLAGNMSAVSSSYYAKVDFDTPDYEVDLSYVLRSDGKTYEIEESQNGTWAKGATTLDIVLSALGFSGNTLVFEDTMGLHLFTFENAIVNGKHTSRLASYFNSFASSTEAVVDNSINITLVTEGARPTVNVKYIFDATANKGTLRFAVNAESLEWITDFTLYTGVFDNIDNRDSHGGKSYINAKWGGGVKVLIDTVAPDAPEFVSGEDTPFSKAFESNYEALPAYGDRVWYTGAYDKYVANIDFNDVFLSSEYRGNIKVYYGIKVVKNRDELLALGDKSIESEYMNITDNSRGYFDRLQHISGDNMGEGSTSIEDGAMNIVNGVVGMRVIYVWAVDQAGNVSDIKSYYVLADNTTYTLNAKVGKNTVADSDASINSFDAEGNALTTFSRGEIATLNTVLGDDFVPFALTLTTNGVANKLLFNYMPSREWTIFAASNEDYINYAQNDSIKLAIDDKDNLGMIDNSKTLNVEFAYRKVVDYTVTNYSVAYNSRPITVEMTFTDSASASSFEYRYFDKDEKELSTAPVKPGEYFVEIYIDKNNENYVTADFAMDGEGKQTFKKVRVAITKGKIVISAVETSEQYGADLTNVLKYTVSGIALEDMADEGITADMLTLALDVKDYSPTGFYSVGFYNVVLKDNRLLVDGVANYDITFMTAQHRVTQRNINIYAQAATKAYGDPDPKFYFGVKGSDLEFNSAKTAQDILDEIFDRTLYVSAGSESGFYLYEAGDRITRAEGEDVWASYKFNSDISLFDINSNYKVILQTQEVFSITKRQVEIDVSGQFSVVKSGVTPSAEGIVPSYTLDAKDAFLADIVANLLEGKLSLAADGTALGEFDTNKYQGATGFAILLGSVDNNNIAISLKSDENYVIYVAKAGLVIVKAKAEFTFVYGEKFEIKYNTGDFAYECDEEVDFNDINWTVSISSEGYLAAGRYVVSFADAKLTKDGVDVEGASVEVQSAIVNITPAEIQIRPTASAFAKVYGEADSVFGIGYEIVKVNGSAIAKDGTYAGLTYDELLATISGSFARARYSKDGNFTAYGTRYDNVLTDSNYYYGYVVNKAFASSNDNFVTNAAIDGEYANVRFDITPKEIVIHTANIVGVSKYFNGNNVVNYDAAGVTMYDLTSQLVLATDKVKLVASDMHYTEIGDASSDTPTHIVFGGFALAGEQSANYTLAYIVLDGHTESIKVNGTKSGENFVIDGTTVEIVYIDNSYTSGTKNDYIYIMFKRIGVEKNDVTIVKEYDNTNALYVDNVIIAKSDDSKEASTAMLIGADKKLIVEESGVFSGVKAGEGYLISRVKLVFTFENGNLSEGSVYDYKDNDVDIRVVGNTIELTVRNVKASIAKKKLNAASFATVAPVNRDYNATTSVDVNYTYADNALVTGDSVESVGLTLVGETNGKDFGQHQVTISAENTKISNANYEVDINDINNNFSGLTVEIEKARLMPNVLFEGKVYDNTTNVTATKKSGNDFTTLYYSDNLREELATIRMSGSVTYTLSAMGAPDANVAVDADGNEIGHNVMISGLTISADDANILKNYRIYGSVYNGGSGYMAFEDAQVGTVEDYEILQAVKVSKKTIKLITNDFQIAPKVYDGSVKATITIQVPVNGGNREGVLAEHKDLLEITATGTFSSAKVGKNIKVTVSAPQLQSKNGIDNNIVNNYYLDKSAGAYASNITGTIIERPVAVEVDLGERIYNGYSEIVKNKLRYTMDGIIESEVRNYNVATVGGAYFIDKNVVLDTNKEVDFKEGNVYNPMFTNMGGFDINYVITYKTSVREDGRDADILAYEDEDGIHYYPQSVPATASAYYYSLRTASKYVDDADYEAAKDYIVGRYKVNGVEVYLVSDDYAGGKDLGETLTYITGKGKIKQRGVYITANSIKKLGTELAEKMFNKQYDGTTKFYGTIEGTNAATDAYRLTSKGIANVIKGDDVHIKNVSAEYNSAYTNAMYVVFTASGLAGKDADNYTIENTNSGASTDSYTAKLSANIQKRIINAALQDGEMVYGTPLGNVGGNVDYSIVGADNARYDLVYNASLKSFFIKAADFLAITGLEVNAENAKYLAQIDAYTYNLVGGEYVKAADGERGTYFKLGGESGNAISSLPKPTATFNMSKPNAGAIAKSYYLVGGTANNFAFKFEYTGTGNDGTSKLVVTKRTLYVTTAGINHIKTYAGTDPAIDLLFDGIASGDGLNIFVNSKGVDYRPVVVLAVYNSETGKYTDAGKYAKTTDTLGANEYYVYYLALPNGLESYDDFAPISNYNVVIGDKNTLKAIAATDESGNVVKDSNGKDVYEFAYSFESDTISKKASTITIKLPEMDGISIDTTNNKFTYTYDKTSGKGVNRVYDVVKGAKTDDEVRYLKDGVASEASDAGTHTGYVTVKRYIKVDDGDTNGYFIEWKSSQEVTIFIERASAQLKAAATYVYYNGKAQSYPVNSISLHEGITSGVLEGQYEMSYKIYKNGQYVDVLNPADIKNAGTYIVTFKLTDEFENKNPNYKKEEVETKFVINQVVVNVSIDKTGYSATTEMNEDKSSITKLRAVYDPNGNYNIGYSVTMGDGYVASNSAIEITKAMTKLAFAKDSNGNERQITGAGKYSFTVSITDENIAGNYALVGNAGVLELTANSFDSDGGSVRIDGDGIVANRLAVRDITDSIVASDINYVAIIKQFMPALSAAANLKDEARVAAVVKMELYCDNQLVVLNGETTSISVAIPSTVNKNLKGIALYTVTKDGTLKKLTDYTVNNGRIEYTTDYVSALVFVDVNPPSLEPWEIGVMVGSILVVVIIVVACVVGIVVRKKKLQKLI